MIATTSCLVLFSAILHKCSKNIMFTDRRIKFVRKNNAVVFNLKKDVF